MDRYESEGLVFDVTDAGPPDGEVVILLHGYPETRVSWDGVLPVLADAGYRVLAPDQRGYSPGARPRGRRAYRLDRLVGDVVALADTAGAEKLHLAGHNWGGGVAWALAGWHPGRLFSMTSLATPHPRALLRSMVSSRQALYSWYFLFLQLPWLPEWLLIGPGQRLYRRTLRRSGLSDAHIDRDLSAQARPGDVVDLDADDRANTSGRREPDLLDALTEWIQNHHRRGGDFSARAISEAGEAAVNALRSGIR